MNEKIAVKSGYYFLLFDKNEVPETLQKSNIQVELGEKVYDLYTGTSLEDERKIDDMFGDRMGYSISEHEVLEKEFYNGILRKYLFFYALKKEGVIFIVLEFKSFYKKPTGNNELSKCKYLTRLDTYGCGCSHNCSYCYAKSLLDFRNLWNPLNPRVADINKIEKTINKIEPGTVVRLGGMTDCFQVFENAYRVTYKTIQLLNKRRIHYLIVTKSDMVASDKYLEILDKELAHIQISITSTDDKVAFKYEKAPSTSRRISAVEKLDSLGYDVQLRLSPFIPELIDFDALNSIKCNRILVEFLRVNTFIKRWFTEIDFDKYTLKQSNYLHLPLDEKIKQIEKITGFKELTVCEDVTEHYNYWRDNVNPNKDDCCNLHYNEQKIRKVA